MPKLACVMICILSKCSRRTDKQQVHFSMFCLQLLITSYLKFAFLQVFKYFQLAMEAVII